MTNVNQDPQTPAGLPLRGLAMVLIAVAVLLGLWGVYAMTRDDSGSTTTSAEESTVVEETTVVEEEPAPGPAPEEAAEPAESAESPEAPAAPAEPGRLNVLNNSTVPNLAAEVADTLDGQGFDIGEVGNLADIIHPENTVYFQPGNAAAEQRARELADRVGGIAKEYNPGLPAETAGPEDITLVLATQVSL